MTAATEGSVHVDSIRLYCQSLQCFPEQHRLV